MDINLHYGEWGSGEPLVLLHGNGEDSSYFEHQIPLLAQTFHVIAVDTRGHGASPRGTKPFTLDQFADDLDDFLQQRGIEAVHLFGFSDGANIAILYALKHPQRVLSLVLNGGNLFPEGLTDDVRAEDAASFEIALNKGDARQLELLHLMMDEPHIDPVSLAAITVPTLVVAGSDDMILESHTRLIARSIPDAQLRFVQGSHFVAVENPDDFNKAIADFYASFAPSAFSRPRS